MCGGSPACKRRVFEAARGECNQRNAKREWQRSVFELNAVDSVMPAFIGNCCRLVCWYAHCLIDVMNWVIVRRHPCKFMAVVLRGAIGSDGSKALAQKGCSRQFT